MARWLLDRDKIDSVVAIPSRAWNPVVGDPELPGFMPGSRVRMSPWVLRLDSPGPTQIYGSPASTLSRCSHELHELVP
jgi:hypothetical protein